MLWAPHLTGWVGPNPRSGAEPKVWGRLCPSILAMEGHTAELGLVKGLAGVATSEPRVQGWSKTQSMHLVESFEVFRDVLSPAGPTGEDLRK